MLKVIIYIIEIIFLYKKIMNLIILKNFIKA